MEEVDGALSVAADAKVPYEFCKNPPALGSVGAYVFQAMNEWVGEINFPQSVANVLSANGISRTLQPFLEDFVSDSDESGGIQLKR